MLDLQQKKKTKTTDKQTNNSVHNGKTNRSGTELWDNSGILLCSLSCSYYYIGDQCCPLWCFVSQTTHIDAIWNTVTAAALHEFWVIYSTPQVSLGASVFSKLMQSSPPPTGPKVSGLLQSGGAELASVPLHLPGLVLLSKDQSALWSMNSRMRLNVSPAWLDREGRWLN